MNIFFEGQLREPDDWCWPHWIPLALEDDRCARYVEEAQVDPQQPIAASLPASLDNNIPDAQLEHSGWLNDL